MVTKKNPGAGPPYAPKKLDLACGQRKQAGFKGIDISTESDADIIHDLLDFPYPIKANSVQEISCQHFVEHIPHYRPEWPKGSDGFFLFFDELYRIMKKGGTARFLHPYVMNVRAFWDPTHVRFIHEATWYYLDKKWREMQGLDHYMVKADFEVITVDGMGMSDEFMSRSPDQQALQRSSYWNVIPDLQVTLKKR